MKNFTFLIILLATGFLKLQAQTPLLTDGRMMPQKSLANGFFYGNDSWKSYWEGTLKRDNQNVGTVTTQSVAWMGAYGLNEKVTLVGLLPYVWTKASGGTLTGFQGVQDLTLAAKYNFYSKDFGTSGLKLYALGSFSAPMTNYNIDLLPLSIGLGTKNFSGRLTGTYAKKQWYVTASGAYTWRSNVSLDRPAYYTNGQLYLTDQVRMYDLFDFIVRLGYEKDLWHAELYYTQQNTLGGGDIRRQDIPFASNQMNFSKVGVSVMYSVPQIKNLALRVWGGYTVAGRNVGQSTSINTGLMYRLNFLKDK